MKNIPVCFIHKGASGYLQYTVAQAAKNNEVYLITDTLLPHDWRNGVLHMAIAEYDHGDLFTQNYVHMSKNPYAYELFCFTRYFILLDFMRKHQLDVVMYLDSDILLFCNATEAYEPFRQHEMTLLHSTTISTSYITYEGLKLFCQFLMDVYSGKEPLIFQELVDKWNRHKNFNQAGGVVDMTLLRIWQYIRTPARIGEMMTVVNGTTFDHNINTGDGYQMDGSHKDYAIGGFHQPYDVQCFHTKLNKWVTFNSLHCQGGTGKKLIPEIFNLCN